MSFSLAALVVLVWPATALPSSTPVEVQPGSPAAVL
jgi:hypothetical protein